MKKSKPEPIPVMDYRQYRRARRLVHECCNYDGGNCIALDDGEECVCVQSISYSLLPSATLGTDPRGNLTRIDNALAQMPQRLEAAKAQLDNLYQQQAAAKEEVGKPFLYEEELRSKNARLVELDTLLNIDGKGQAHTESVVAKSTRPSVLDNLKRPVQPRSTDKKPKQHEEVR